MGGGGGGGVKCLHEELAINNLVVAGCRRDNRSEPKKVSRTVSGNIYRGNFRLGVVFSRDME